MLPTERNPVGICIDAYLSVIGQVATLCLTNLRLVYITVRGLGSVDLRDTISRVSTEGM
jgi:hypothetical protein